MRKLLLTCLFLLFILSCGPVCPPCPDDSGNLGISQEHWEILDCAGPEWPEYVEDNVYFSTFHNELIVNDKEYLGRADCDCSIIKIKYQDSTVMESRTIVHETAHLKEGCNSERYAVEIEFEFCESLRINRCSESGW